MSLSAESPSPERRMEAEREDVSFSGSREPTHSSLSLDSVLSSGRGQSEGPVGRGASDTGSPVPRSSGRSSVEEAEAFPVWLGVRRVGVGDGVASGTGERVVEFSVSGEGVKGSMEGHAVLWAAVEAGTVDQSSRPVGSSEVGCVVWPGVPGWLPEVGSEVGLAVVGTSVGASVKESVAVSGEVRASAFDDASCVLGPKVSGCAVVTAEVTGGEVVGRTGTVVGLGVDGGRGVTEMTVASVAPVDDGKGEVAAFGVAEEGNGLKFGT